MTETRVKLLSRMLPQHLASCTSVCHFFAKRNLLNLKMGPRS